MKLFSHSLETYFLINNFLRNERITLLLLILSFLFDLKINKYDSH